MTAVATHRRASSRRRVSPAARKSRVGTVAVHIAAAVFFVMAIFPVYWMVATSFKLEGDIQRSNPKWLPFPGTVQHFVDALHKPMFWTYARNSMIAAGSTVLISIVIAFLAATAVARFKFYGRRFFLALLITTQMVPLTALAIPLYLSLRSFHLLNQMPGLIMAYAAFVLPFTVWTLRGFIQGIPVDLEEAAMVDGCSRLQAFRRILLPLILPGLIATAVFAFIQAWNDYLFPLVLMQHNDNYTMTVWLASFSTNRGNDFGGLMAASTLFSLPVVVLFMIVQRKVVSGLTAGAVKG